MDSLTQLTLGAAVGEAALGKQIGKKAPLWGAVFGTLPDLDVLANPFLSEMQALALHRGLTHSLLFMVVMAPLMGGMLHRVHRAENLRARAWGGMVFAVLATHVLLDCLTTYGTQVFFPFSTYPVIFGTVFIIDPLYTVPLAGGLLTALWFSPADRRRRWANYIGLGLSTAYLAFTCVNKLYIEHTFEQALDRQQITHERLFTKPTALNNILWTGIAEDSTGFWIGRYSLLDDDQQIHFRRVPKNHDLLGDASDSPAVQRLRWFSRGLFTVSRSGSTLYIHDLRFGRNDLGMTEDGQYVFTFRLKRNSTGHVTDFAQADPSFQFDAIVLKRFWARVLGRSSEPRRQDTYTFTG